MIDQTNEHPPEQVVLPIPPQAEPPLQQQDHGQSWSSILWSRTGDAFNMVGFFLMSYLIVNGILYFRSFSFIWGVINLKLFKSDNVPTQTVGIYVLILILGSLTVLLCDFLITRYMGK
jgi:hypothetical protein